MIFVKALSVIGLGVLMTGAAMAQSTTTPPTNPSSPTVSDQAPAPIPGTMQPTVVQCNQGYSDSMSMSKEQFAKACVDQKARNSGG